MIARLFPRLWFRSHLPARIGHGDVSRLRLVSELGLHGIFTHTRIQGIEHAIDDDIQCGADVGVARADGDDDIRLLVHLVSRFQQRFKPGDDASLFVTLTLIDVPERWTRRGTVRDDSRRQHVHVRVEPHRHPVVQVHPIRLDAHDPPARAYDAVLIRRHLG